MFAHDQFWIAFSLLGIGVVTFVLCLPLIYRKVPMNRFYGIRLPQSFVSALRWYDINAYGGRVMARWSCLIMLAGAIGFLVPSRFFLEYACLAGAVVLVSLVVPLIQIIRWARADRQT